jgi:hypothetical protein
MSGLLTIISIFTAAYIAKETFMGARLAVQMIRAKDSE